MTGHHTTSNRDLESAKLYHLNRSDEEASKARAACNANAKSSHERLAALHADALKQLNEIATLQTEIRDRIG